MIEIIPNWHPIFVHFTVALMSTAVGFAVLAYIAKFFKKIPETYVTQFEIVSRWCLWIVVIITIGTILAGFYAYNTVNHDATSHIAMTHHRNWALATAVIILLMGCWSLWRYIKGKEVTLLFVIAMLIAEALLLCTAWRGSELVYRYGLGVMSLPQAEGSDHHHHDSSKKSSPAHNHHPDSHE